MPSIKVEDVRNSEDKKIKFIYILQSDTHLTLPDLLQAQWSS